MGLFLFDTVAQPVLTLTAHMVPSSLLRSPSQSCAQRQRTTLPNRKDRSSAQAQQQFCEALPLPWKQTALIRLENLLKIAFITYVCVCECAPMHVTAHMKFSNDTLI